MAQLEAVKKGASASWQGPLLRAVAAALPLAVSLLAGGAAQAQTHTPPEGCSGYLTVQSRDCRVSNHYTCAGEPAGHRWRVDFSPDGPFHVVLIDGETQWLEMRDLGFGGWSVKRLQRPAPDPASMAEILEQGQDTYRFAIEDQAGGIEIYSGFDLLTGDEVEIDGERLLRTEFTAFVQDGQGQELRQISGAEYIHPEFEHFIGGVATVTQPDGTKESFDGSPMRFVRPGEPGFFTTRPAYGCAETLSDAVWRP